MYNIGFIHKRMRDWRCEVIYVVINFYYDLSMYVVYLRILTFIFTLHYLSVIWLPAPFVVRFSLKWYGAYNKSIDFKKPTNIQFILHLIL